MNQPTEDRFKQIEERLSKIERYTEPIRITKMEIEAGSIFRQLDEVQEDTNILKIQMEGVRADISATRATQSDHTAFLAEHRRQLKEIEEKQEAHTEILGQLMNFGERIEAAMATKDDIARIEKTQAEQGQKLDLILKLLQKGE